MIGCILAGCDKFLDEKSDIKLSIPETFEDLRALMNYEGQLNRSFPSLLESGSDDYYVKTNVLKSRSEPEQLVYMWENNFQRSDNASWDNLYNIIMIANIVLEGLDRIDGGLEIEREVLMGEALFVRSYAYFNLAQIFCLPYDFENKESLLGLPLRTSSDYSVKFERASMAETYSFIINDLLKAIDLLPAEVQFKSRPSKSAAIGVLAKIHLIMGMYEEARYYANEALQFNSKLLDYNELDETLRIPFPIAHDEIIYYGFSGSGYFLASSRAFIPKELYNLYQEKDLRKKLFFNISSSGDVQFKGNYDGVGGNYFAGIATDELYLITTESNIRLGDVEKGLSFLNKLLRLRYETGEFVDYVNLSGKDALELVLTERRKQLVKRGIRWTDLRRYLNEPDLVKTLYRKLDNGEDNSEYKLEPDSKNYFYPIPPDVVRIHKYEQSPF